MSRTLTNQEVIRGCVITRWEVEYECVNERGSFGAKFLDRHLETFDYYSLDVFAGRCPAGWEIRRIERYYVPDA